MKICRSRGEIEAAAVYIFFPSAAIKIMKATASRGDDIRAVVEMEKGEIGKNRWRNEMGSKSKNSIRACQSSHVQTCKKRERLGCVNPATRLPLAAGASSRNLAITFSCMSVCTVQWRSMITCRDVQSFTQRQVRF